MEHPARRPEVTLGDDRRDVWQGLTERLDPGPKGVADALTHILELHVVRLHPLVLLSGLGLHRLDAFSAGLDLASELPLEFVDFGHGLPRFSGSRRS